MKKFVFITSTLCLCLICPFLLDITKSAMVDEKIEIKTTFKMDIFEDGKISDDKMLVDLTIIKQERGGFYVEWNEVYIKPIHENKAVILKPVYYSILDGSINNVTATKTGFSFNIDLSKRFPGKGRTFKIEGTKKEEGSIFDKYDVTGSGLWWSELLQTPIRREFRSTDEKIILPYREVFGE